MLAGAPSTLGVIKLPRGRFRLWVENFNADGGRHSIGSVELDSKQIIVLVNHLVDKLDI